MSSAVNASSKPGGNLTKSLLRHGIWVTLGRISNLVVAFFTSIVVANFIDQADFGVYSAIYSFAGFFALLATFGLDRIAQFQIGRSNANHPDQVGQVISMVSRVFWWTSLTTLAMASLVLMLKSEVIFGTQLSWGIWAAVLVLIFARAAVMVFTSICRALDQAAYANMFGGAINSGPFANGIFLIGLVLLGMTLGVNWQVAITMISAVTFGVAGLLAGRVWQIKQRLQHDSSAAQANCSHRELLECCLPVLGIGLAAAAISELDVVVVSTFAVPDEVALYAAAKRLVLLLVIPLGLINLVVISRVSELYASRKIDALSRMLSGAAALASIPSLLACACFLIFPEQALHIVFPAGYAAASPILVAFIPGQLAFVFSGACGVALVQTGFARLALYANLIGAVCFFLLGPLTLIHWGVVPFTYVVSFGIALRNGLSWYFAWRYARVTTHPSYLILWTEAKRLAARPAT